MEEPSGLKCVGRAEEKKVRSEMGLEEEGREMFSSVLRFAGFCVV